jgi:hypothetical protein
MERYSYYGNMTIAFESNPGSHIDIPCLNHSFYLDGDLIIEEGEIVHPSCR